MSAKLPTISIFHHGMGEKKQIQSRVTLHYGEGGISRVGERPKTMPDYFQMRQNCAHILKIRYNCLVLEKMVGALEIGLFIFTFIRSAECLNFWFFQTRKKIAFHLSCF